MRGKERVGGVAGRQGARLRGAGVELRGCGRSWLGLVEEEYPFCLGGKVHRRTSWMEQAWHREGLLRRPQKAWAYRTSDHLPIPFKDVSEILKNVKVKMCQIQASGLDCPIGIEARSEYRVVVSS